MHEMDCEKILMGSQKGVIEFGLNRCLYFLDFDPQFYMFYISNWDFNKWKI